LCTAGVHGEIGGDGSPSIAFASAAGTELRIGGSVFSETKESTGDREIIEAVDLNESPKLSNGLASGGEISTETGGRRLKSCASSEKSMIMANADIRAGR
jgi:hypothetical protein